MQKQLNTWKLLAECLEKNIPVMLLYVLESKGSSPGRQGFFMVVDADGRMEGSIGGGIMEHKWVSYAMEKLRVTGYGLGGQLEHQVHDKVEGAKQSGMICSGEQTIFIYRVKQRELPVIRSIIQTLENNRNATFVLGRNGVGYSENIPANYSFTFNTEIDWEYKEKIGYKNQLFIVGGGHCALAFSKLMRDMDFYITVFEERPNLNTLEKNGYAHEKIIVDDYTALNKLISSGPGQYVVVMTFGYRTDDVAIRSLLEKNFTYFGVLGSKAKIEKMFSDYIAEGISEELLKKIHAPIGIPISSQTPEEIAISIAAEIIKVKNGFYHS